jgi:hypothetical protein
MLRCEQKEGEVLFVFGSKDCKRWFRPQQSSSYRSEKVKLYYKVFTKNTIFCSNCQLQSFAKNLQPFGTSFGLTAFGATILQRGEGMKKSGNMVKENHGKEDR